MESFENLTAWQIGMDLAEEIYKISKKFPKEEVFGITSQMRRASIGVIANIAEGYSRSGSNDKAYKYTIARGECAEIHALLLAGVRIGLLTKTETDKAIELSLYAGKLLSGLIKRYAS